jgi:hypothetical protein
MKPEDKKRLKRFWLRQGVLLCLAITVLVLSVSNLLSVPLLWAIAHGAEVPEARFHMLKSFFVTVAMLVGSIGLSFIPRLDNPYPLSYSGHLLLPEETIAELIALKRRLQTQNKPRWKIYCELIFWEILPLFWAQHIQIRLQNLSLPPSKKRNTD